MKAKILNLENHLVERKEYFIIRTDQNVWVLLYRPFNNGPQNANN